MQWLSKLFFSLVSLLLTIQALSAVESGIKLTGAVFDETGQPLSGATVMLVEENRGIATNRRGLFAFNYLQSRSYILKISFVGHTTVLDTVMLQRDTHLNIQLRAEATNLTELTVSESISGLRNVAMASPSFTLGNEYVAHNLSGSLMTTLSRLPGISSLNIGSGQSKPVIRGMGFNRVVVAENGIKHQAQEWGGDHGLEIDQFNIDKIDIVMGPASLLYGSNAIGGAINLRQNKTPAKNTFGGSGLIHAKSNNEHIASSWRFFKRFEKLFLKSHFSIVEYADYRVPTDSITYLSYVIPLHNNRLRNTAGQERSGSITLGYIDNNFSTNIRMMNHFSQSGFFANVHGLEIRNSTINFDTLRRDMDLPMQRVNHFKLMSNTVGSIHDVKMNFDFGYQNNHRQEFSEAVSHGFMPVPPDSLERIYRKQTWSANAKFELPAFHNHHITTGISMEYQHNEIGGWGFLLPAFRLLTGGVFLYDKIPLNTQWDLKLAARYDRGFLQSKAWYEWFTTPQPDGTHSFEQRASNLNKQFGNISWGIGAVRKGERVTWRMNLGKSFRMPSAKELASNGVNYHMYRFERGDSTLNAEQSYQLDIGWEFNTKKWKAYLTPFVQYFPNYIYLNPTASYWNAQQIYYYTQNQVFRAGSELMIQYRLTNEISASIDAEYVFSRQLDGSKKGFTLPFSPPFVSNFELTYAPQTQRFGHSPWLSVLVKMVASQNQIVPPELKTPGFMLVGLQAGTHFKLRSTIVNVNARIDNLLNQYYYDHTDFYRLIGVPGQGANAVLSLGIEF